MVYLCLICLDQEKWDALPAKDRETLDRESKAYDDALAKRGVYYKAAALKPVDTATTVRWRNGKPAVVDGPFAETKEHLGGFILIEAKDLDDAIAIASGVPTLKVGSVEIRAVHGMRA